MAITSYITSAEASLLYPNDSSFSSDQRALALTMSFGLVNSYISIELKLPVVPTWDGESTTQYPDVLKKLQAEFYQWQLEFGNQGFSEEGDAFYKSIVEKCKAITDNELTVTPEQIYAAQAGWHIVNKTNSQNGNIYIKGLPPVLKEFYTLSCGAGQTTTQYPSGIYLVAKRAESATALTGFSNLNQDWYQWRSIYGQFEVRFDGQWGASWEVRIMGIPESMVNEVGTPNGLTQAPLQY